jgi:hypothetical protein
MAVVDTCDGKRLFSFLSIEWAIVAAIDSNSEKYRFLGEHWLMRQGEESCGAAIHAQVVYDLQWKG